MAINTTFTAGAVLTAQQMNNLPWGIVSQTENTSSNTTISAVAAQITSPSFTAVAGRQYLVTYFEPELSANAASGYFDIQIRLTNAAGTLLAGAAHSSTGSTNYFCTSVSKVLTFSAGAVVLVGCLAYSSGNGKAGRTASAAARLIIQDIGPS